MGPASDGAFVPSSRADGDRPCLPVCVLLLMLAVLIGDASAAAQVAESARVWSGQRPIPAGSAVLQYLWMRRSVAGGRVEVELCSGVHQLLPDSTLRALADVGANDLATVRRVTDCGAQPLLAPIAGAPPRVRVLWIGTDPGNPLTGVLHATALAADGVSIRETAYFTLPSWRASRLEISGFETAQPPPPEFRGDRRNTASALEQSRSRCGDPGSRLGSSLLAYLRAMLTRPRFHYLAPKFGLNVADSASIRMITDPAECERAAHAFIRERKATLPKLVYVAAIGDARWVEDPETKAGEYIAGVVFTATYDSVLALPGR